MLFKLILGIDILKSFMWNDLHVNAIEPHWWQVNIDLGNDLVPSGNKPLPELVWQHQSISWISVNYDVLIPYAGLDISHCQIAWGK